MISKVSVTNFKNHAQTEIELGRVTALVGPNGCGKTSLLQSTYYLGQLADQTVERVFSRERDPSHLVRQGCESFTVTLHGQQPSATAEQQPSATKWKTSVIYTKPSQSTRNLHIEFEWQWDNEESHRADLIMGETLANAKPNHFIIRVLKQIIYFKAMMVNLSAPSYSEQTLPQIAPDGSGLASAAAYLMTAERERHQEVEAALRTIVPTVKRVRAKPAKVTLHERKIFSVNETRVPIDEQREVTGQELIFDTIDADGLPAHVMSDGTLLALGLLTALWSPASPQLILLDDVEQGLHPLAQRRLMHTLKEFAEKQDRQIILTSHSPYIVDELEAKDVWVMATDPSGVSQVKRLSDHPDAKRLLSVLTTGEFVGAVGEDWVVGDAAPAEEVNA